MKTPWTRKDHSGADGGGGVMALMGGRVFEKVGCHASTVLWHLRAGIRQADPGRRQGPALLGERHLLHRPSREPQRSDRAYEHAHGGDVAKAGSAAAAISPPC